MRKSKKGARSSDTLAMGCAPSGRKALRTIIVSHPVYGSFRALHVRDKLQAVQAAAKEWKLQWSKIAKECSFTDDLDAD